MNDIKKIKLIGEERDCKTKIILVEIPIKMIEK